MPRRSRRRAARAASPSMLARSSASVSNSLAGARELVVDLGQHLLLHLANRDLDVRARAVGEREGDLLRLPGRRARRARPRSPGRACRRRARRPCRAAPLRRRRRGRRRACRPRCAGRSPAGASSATDSRSASISASTDSCGTSTSARGTSSVVQSTSSGSGCTSTVATKLHAVVGGIGQLELVLRVGDRAHAAARRGAPEPAADVAVDRLRVDPVLAEPRDEHLRRDLPLAEAGDLDALRQVRHRVVDRVPDLIGRHVDRQADAVLAEGLDSRGHSAIQPAAG